MNFSHSRTACFAVLLLLCSLAGTGHASVVIDDFSTGEYSSPLGQSISVFDHIDSGSMYGGSRRTYGKAHFPNLVNATVDVQNGLWSMAGASGGIERISATWGRTSFGAAASDTALNANLTALDQFFQFDVASVEANTKISLRVYSGVDEGNAVSGGFNHTFSTSSTVPQTVSVNFTETVLSSVDFSDVDGLELRLEFPSTDFSVSEFRVGEAAAPVPEPGHILIFVGAIGLAFRRKRD